MIIRIRRFGVGTNNYSKAGEAVLLYRRFRVYIIVETVQYNYIIMDVFGSSSIINHCARETILSGNGVSAHSAPVYKDMFYNRLFTGYTVIINL